MSNRIIHQYLNGLPDRRVSRLLTLLFDRVLPLGKNLGGDVALTAFAGGGQGSAKALNPACAYHEVTTVATAADSIALPAALEGQYHFVKNSAALAMQVFGSGTDTIDSVATATGVSQPAGEACIYVCLIKGNYLRLNSVNGLTATAAMINRADDVTTRIVTTTATALAITQALHGSRIVLVKSTVPIAITLPAATGSGEKYALAIGVAATATAHTIKVANTADAITGVSVLATTDTAQVAGFATTATDDTVTLNGTTKGGLVGDQIEFIDVAASLFTVRIIGRATGTMVTPFSATV